MTPISFAKNTESYEVSFVTIDRQISYDSGILHQDYGIIRGFLVNHTRLPIGSLSGKYIHRKGAETGGTNYYVGTDCVGHAYLQWLVFYYYFYKDCCKFYVNVDCGV